jgi:2-polyprenyl-6-methoxyphenol hydroxylase-like FAD-dependent oxidoreductase
MKIAIIGSGPVGLITAHLLKNRNIPFKIFEKESKLRRLPSAHYLGIRSMEIINEIDDLRNSINDILEDQSRFRYYKYVKRIGDDRDVLMQTDHFDKDQVSFFNNLRKKYSHECFAHIPQHRFLDFLHEQLSFRFDEENIINFNHELISLERHDDYILKFRQNNEIYQENFDFVLGCDGAHSKVRDLSGFSFQRKNNILEFLNIHFQSSKLSELIRDYKQEAMLHFVYNSKTVGCLVNHSYSEGEFVLQLPISSTEKLEYQTRLKNKKILYQELHQIILTLFSQNFSEILKKDPANITIKNVGMWTMGNTLVNSMARFHDNKGIALLGDSAHTMPPSGGLGLNTGIQDAFNLVHQINLFYNDKDLGRDCFQNYSKERKKNASDNINLAMKNYEITSNLANCLGLNMTAYNLLDQVSSFLPFGKSKLQ